MAKVEKNEIVNTLIDYAMRVTDDWNADYKDKPIMWDEVEIPITVAIDLVYNSGEPDVLELPKRYAPKSTGLF